MQSKNLISQYVSNICYNNYKVQVVQTSLAEILCILVNFTINDGFLLGIKTKDL